MILFFTRSLSRDFDDMQISKVRCGGKLLFMFHDAVRGSFGVGTQRKNAALP